MRFRGGGVGHVSTRVATDIFKEDRDTLDTESRNARQQQPTDSQEEDIGSDQENENQVNDKENQVTEEGYDEDLSESELIDYGYEVGEEEEEDNKEGGDNEEYEGSESSDVEGEDNVAVDELAALGFGEY
jgi:hypothetical protein